MALIKNRKPVVDCWRLLDFDADGGLPVIPRWGDVIVPAAAWRTASDELVGRDGRLGVWLTGEDEAADIAHDLDAFALIAIRFASFTDGSGYSLARLLRERYRWRGELRAIGDVQRGQLLYLYRCGFDAFDLREGEDIETALAAFDDFSEDYRASSVRPQTLFRRRAGRNAR
jgi:uncharacterized protein (DUF934 family)